MRLELLIRDIVDTTIRESLFRIQKYLNDGGFSDRITAAYARDSLVIGGSDKSPTNASVALELKSTAKAFLVSRMTTTQRDTLNAVNGMIIYNETTNKFQGYENGAWANLI